MASALAGRLKTIRDRGGIRSRDIAQLLNTSPETVSRWNNGKVDPQREHLNALLALEWMVDQLAVLYSPEDARLWLFSRQKLLNGDRPVDRIQSGNIDDVLSLIAQLQDGAYV
jgi:transcriptional regulator with XRE-family HTH domain